jgi:hypothetical protein
MFAADVSNPAWLIMIIVLALFLLLLAWDHQRSEVKSLRFDLDQLKRENQRLKSGREEVDDPDDYGELDDDFELDGETEEDDYDELDEDDFEEQQEDEDEDDFEEEEEHGRE